MNRSVSKAIIFSIMLALNWIPVFFCTTFYYNGAPFVFPILLIMLFLLCIGNYFASFSLTQFVALSFCLIASAVIATTLDTDCYTTYISDDGWSYGIGFVATIIATLIVLFCSFVAFLIKQERMKQ